MLSNSNEFAKNISDLPRVLGTRVLIVIEGGDLIWGGGRATVGVSALYALTPTAYNFFFIYEKYLIGSFLEEHPLLMRCDGSSLVWKLLAFSRVSFLFLPTYG